MTSGGMAVYLSDPNRGKGIVTQPAGVGVSPPPPPINPVEFDDDSDATFDDGAVATFDEG